MLHLPDGELYRKVQPIYQVSVTSLSHWSPHLIGQKNFDSHSYQLGLIWDAMSERQQTVKLSKEAAEKRGNKLDNDMMRV